jgi:hypothetical protein
VRDQPGGGSQEHTVSRVAGTQLAGSNEGHRLQPDERHSLGELVDDRVVVVETVTFARVSPQGVHRMPALSSIAMSEGRRRFRSRSAVTCWVKSGDRLAAAAARRAALRYRTAAW